MVIIVGCLALAVYTRSLCPVWEGGSAKYFWTTSINEPGLFIANVWHFFFSLNKGLLAYCPVIILCLLSIKTAHKVQPRIVWFAVATLAGLVIGFAFVWQWSEETWGPRYLLATVAPLIICFAASRGPIPVRLRKKLALAILAAVGFFIAFLGTFFYYGLMPAAAGKVGQATLEDYQSNPNWNQIRFDWQLMKAWARQTPPGQATWPPPPHYWFGKPADAPELKTVDLHDYATPQPQMVRGWEVRRQGGGWPAWFLTMILMAIGLLLLIYVGYQARKRDSSNRTREAGF